MDKLKKKVYQPADQFDAFGEVIQFVNCKLYDNAIGVDAALIEITDIKRRPTSGRFPNADSPFCGKDKTFLTVRRWSFGLSFLKFQ